MWTGEDYISSEETEMTPLVKQLLVIVIAAASSISSEQKRGAVKHMGRKSTVL
jgi:hypothetical protein